MFEIEDMDAHLCPVVVQALWKYKMQSITKKQNVPGHIYFDQVDSNNVAPTSSDAILCS